MSKIKVLDRKGIEHEIEEVAWNNLKNLPDCNYRLAEIETPQAVIEFTSAKTIDKFIEEKKCCKDGDDCCVDKPLKAEPTPQEKVVEIATKIIDEETAKYHVKKSETKKGRRPKNAK